MENNIEKHIEEICIKASNASKNLFHASSETKNLALESIAKHINKNKNEILKANSIDMDLAKKIIFLELYWIDYSSTNLE